MLDKNLLKTIKSPIISCSRRTDAPAFLMDWLIKIIKQGFVDVVNPFNKKQVSRISLQSEDVKCWVFWSKDYKNFIKYYKSNASLFDKYDGIYFQFTINSPSEMESLMLSPLDIRLEQLEWLIREFGIDAVSYRFDPIVIYKKKGSDKILSNLDKFEYIIDKVAKMGVEEMIFSFCTLYPKVIKRMKARGKCPINLDLTQKRNILSKLLEITNKYGVRMKACCQPELLDINTIKQAHCIDAKRIEKITGNKIVQKKDTGQRSDCGCTVSRDIGGYEGIFRCKHNCDYCYASPIKK
ncbi:MAG: DUF1848 family protein [Candidatus Lokiarchaeota archaeon]|nr:DUF1848 family protein [Candidatus Lokiarchaeota archaeon]